MDASELRGHLEARIETAAMCPFPFPHMVIEDFFPPETYEQILRFNLFQWNAGREWIAKRDMLLNKNTTPYDHRLQINFHSNDPYDAPDEAREFWGTIAQTFLADDWFPRLVYRKYPDYFTLRFGEAVNDAAFWPRIDKQLFLQRHIPDYRIGPHTDIATRVFTCIFSFADRPGFEEYGTQLMRHRDPNKRCWGDKHHSAEDFEVVKVAPYRPNNFLLFFKTRHSFHGVKTISPDVPNQRYGMQFQFHEPWGGVFEDLSRPGLMVPDHDSSLAKAVSSLDGAMDAGDKAALAAARHEIEVLMQREVDAAQRAEAAAKEADQARADLAKMAQETERLRTRSLLERILNRPA
jgi:hypothetical protein